MIADRVQKTFMTKMSMYYKKLAEYLSTLDVSNIELDSTNDIVETPIEDFIQTNLPTTFIKYYGIEAVYKEWTDNKNKTYRTLDHFEPRRNSKIDSFDEIFNFTIENWKKFKNCIQGQEQFLAWSNDSSQIAVSHWNPKNITTMPAPWKDFLEEKMSVHFQMRLITYLGMCIDSKNTSQQYLIISDKGGTGKGVMARALEYALPKGSIAPIDGNVLADSNEFGLSGIKVWNSHISLMEEYDSNTLQSNKAKKFIANNPMDLNVKGKNFVHWEPINHKLIVFSNKGAVIKDYANRRRAIPLTFKGKYEWTNEKATALNESAEDFLNYCYTVYKNNPLLVNGNYLVLSEEDEKDFLQNKLQEKDEEILSKRAFNEDSLKEYFKTDEYSDTDEYCDFENTFVDLFVYSKGNYLTSKDIQEKIKKYCCEHKDVAQSFGVIFSKDDVILNTKSKDYWKWLEFLKGKGIERKTVRIGNKTMKVCYNMKLA